MRPVIRNAKRGGPRPRNNLPKGAAKIATSDDERALLEAAMYGNRATRRLAIRNIRKRQKAAESSNGGGRGA